MKRLSGWARLWIGSAVLMWSGGGWWLSENLPRRHYEIACVSPVSTWWGGSTEEEAAELEACLDADARRYLANKQAMDAAEARRERDHQWQLWSRIGAVAFAPVLAGLVFWTVLLLARWVWRGFAN